MKTFAESYGIEMRDDQGVATASLLITDSYMNGSGCAFGGSLILLGNAAGQAAIGPDACGVNYSFRYLRKALENETVTAKANVIKQGRNSNAVLASVEANGQLIGGMYADYFRESKALPFRDAKNLLDIKRPPCDMVLNSPENIAGAGKDGDFVRLFTDTITHHHLSQFQFGSRVSVGLYTDETFCDIKGDVDPALIGMLFDETLGIACIEAVGPLVTTNLNISLLERIKPGAFITCSGELLIQSGRLLETHGAIFADDSLVGTCTGTYISIIGPNTAQ